MESVRYYLALLLWISMPPAFVWWFLIHPFVGFWRRLGVAWTYALITAGSLLLAWGMFLLRRPALRVEFGTNPATLAAGGVLFVLCVALGLKRRRQLSQKILVGVPEIDPERYPRRLLTEGVYARIRHPRYVEVALGVAAYALIANYLAGYLVLALTVAALLLIVPLEERELIDFFGREYEDYRRRVPRYIPRRRR